ncbi:MAG: hypothetical protein IKS12_07125 [Eubacterium sp.]|nr:hypothetical protein [Eubacterium sp.]
MKLFYNNQRNYKNLSYNKPDGSSATISSSGCGVVSACIAINTLAQKSLFSVAEMRDLSKSCGARIMNGTNEITLLNAICKKHSAFSYTTTRDVNKLVEHLKKGGVAICNQGDAYNIFSTSGHYVCAWRMVGNNIEVADPSMYSGKYDTAPRPKRIVKKTDNGCVVTPSQMAKATQDRYPSYYLITYKKPNQTTTTTKKTLDVIAKEVINGKWGVGDDRKKRLKAAGYDAAAVQKRVNEILAGSKTTAKKSITVIAKEVIDGKWGNGADRVKRLTAAGYDAKAVQKEVNRLLK